MQVKLGRDIGQTRQQTSLEVFSTIAESFTCVERFSFVISWDFYQPLSIVGELRYTFVCSADIPNNSGLNKVDVYFSVMVRVWM